MTNDDRKYYLQSKNYMSNNEIITALCIWEAANMEVGDPLMEVGDPLLEWLCGGDQELGVGHGREMAIHLAPILNEAWKASREMAKDDFPVAFDYEYTPFVLGQLRLTCESPDNIGDRNTYKAAINAFLHFTDPEV